jgi:D-aspartate ligase
MSSAADATGRTARPTPVLVLGKHLTGLGVLRAFAMRGLDTYAVEDTADVIVRSRYYRPAPERLPETDDSDMLAAYLRRLPFEQAVLMPCSDRWAAGVAGLPPDLRRRYPASVSTRVAVDELLDKARFRDLVAVLEIPHPRTIRLTTPSDLEAVSDADLVGSFLKPTASQRHNVVFGTKGFFVESRALAETRVEAGAAAGITFLLQEWIPGGLSDTVLLDGFVDRHGVRLAMTARRRIRMNPPRLGNTTSAVTVPLDSVAPAIDSMGRLLEAVAYRGVFNAEFKIDARDGTFRIIEVNPRLAWFSASLRGTGVDLPWMAYRDALGLDVPRPRIYRIGRYGVSETPDAIAIARAWGAGRRPDGPVLKPWLRGDHVLFAWSDPYPLALDVWRALTGRARAIRHGLLARVSGRRGAAGGGPT